MPRHEPVDAHKHVLNTNKHPTDKHLDRRQHPDRVPLDERGAARHPEVLKAHQERASKHSLHPHGSNVEHPGNTGDKDFGCGTVTSPHNNVGSTHMPHVRRHA